jgi:uncharacterized membrane protein
VHFAGSAKQSTGSGVEPAPGESNLHGLTGATRELSRNPKKTVKTRRDGHFILPKAPGEATVKRKFLACLLTPVAGVAAAAAGHSVDAARFGATGENASGGVEWHSIDFPGGTGTVALDISAAGEIVGSFNNISGTHGFRRSPSGEFVSIDVPRSNFTRVAGINSNGDMVGTHRLISDPMATRHGFLLRDGEFTTIDPPGAVFTNPLGINSSGDIVGRFCTTVPCMPEGPTVHGFLLRDGVFSTIDVPLSRGTNAWKINARGDIVGG